MLALVAAGCGGGGGDNSATNSQSQNYDPAQTTLKQAGLEACDALTKQTAGTFVSKDGLIATRAFAVARDCNGSKTSPDTMAFNQYDSGTSTDAAAAKLKQSHPSNIAYTTYAPLVIVATGPHRTAYIESIRTVLSKRGQGTTTTTTG